MIIAATLLALGTTIEPAVLYSFEDLTDPTIDSKGLCNLSIPTTATATPQVQQASTVSVGSFLVFDYGAREIPAKGHGLTWQAKTCAPSPHAKGLTIEFLLHPTPQCFLRGGSAGLIGNALAGDKISFTLTYEGFTFTAKTTGDEAEDDGVLQTHFHGEGVLASDYLWSTTAPAGKWSHFALVRDGATGDMSVWIDGESQPAMRKNGTALHRARGPQTMRVGSGGLELDVKNAVALCAGLDEVAVYEEALPPSLIYAHYTDAINQSKPYRPTDPGGKVPTTEYPDGDNASYYDLNEYPMGTILPSPGKHEHPPRPGGGGNGTICSGCMSCADQVRYAPEPRYNASALARFKTPYHFNWMDPWNYMAGQDVPRRERLNVTLDLMKTLSSKWRYGWMLGGSKWMNESIEVVNAHTEWPVHALIPGERGQLFNHSLPKGCYMQDDHGRYITILGDLIPAGKPPTLRPMSAKTASAQGCPDSIFNSDGDEVRQKRFQAFADSPQRERSIDILNSDGEVFIGLMSHKTPSAPAEHWDYSKDAVSRADFGASGQPNWESYFSEWRTRLTNGWSYRVMAPYRKVGGLFDGTRFSMYQVQGDNPYFGNWSITREISDPMPNARAGNQTYFSTADIYVPRPAEWWKGGGPDHGIGWLQTVRRSERAAGDDLFSPFLAAGWSQQVERNLRPAQWLGMLKVLAAWGAEWFYVGFFSLRAPFQDSANWCWQALTPIYAHALIVTQAADFFYRGDLVLNDQNTSFALEDDGTQGSPLLWAGAPNVLAIARKYRGAYLLVVTLQRLSNNARNLKSYPPETRSKGRKCEVRLPGVAAPVVVYARPQGSVYIVHNATMPHPKIVQLDEWHEASHPTRWLAARDAA